MISQRLLTVGAFLTIGSVALLSDLAEGRGPSGGFRGGASSGGRGPSGPTPGGHGPPAGPGSAAATHSMGIHGGGPAGASHGAAPMAHGGAPGGHPGGYPGGSAGGHPGFHAAGPHETHYAAMMHSSGPHWNSYHQAFVGNHPVRLAYAGYHPSYYYHPWYHGPWRGYAWGWGWGFGPGVTFGIAGAGWGLSVGNGWGYGPYGPYGYSGYPLGWGFGGWGLGGMAYSSGYYPYYNPYYAPVVYQPVVYDYSRPIPVASRAPVGAANNANANAPMDPMFEAARQAFRQGDFNTAQRDVDLAIARNPNDAVFHEFRALVLFAQRDYRQSAATLHSLLAIGPGWDWTTMSSLYADPFVYTEQLRGLEQYVRANPQAADAHFVLAYHYMIAGHKEASVAQLQQVKLLMPNDRLAGELLTMVKGPPQALSADPTAAPMPNSPPAPGADPSLPPPAPPATVASSSSPAPIDQSRLPGSWRASRDDGSTFGLTLTEDGKFRWKFAVPNQKGDEFGGTYTVDGGVLVLERAEGGALAGAVSFDDNGRMNFKLVGAPPEDKGLSFGK